MNKTIRWVAGVVQYAVIFWAIVMIPLMILSMFTTDWWATISTAIITGGLGGYVADRLDPDGRQRRRRARNLRSS